MPFRDRQSCEMRASALDVPGERSAAGFGCARLLADHVVFQRMQLLAELLDALVEQVADGEHSAKPPVGIDHGEVAEMVREHEG